MPAAVPIHNTWGATLVGVFFGILYGILTLQVYIYYLHYPKDRINLKSLVGLIWSLETLHTIFISHMVYTYLVTGFGDYTALQESIWSSNLQVLVTSIIACISQVFFVLRCWMLDKGMLNTIFSVSILFVAAIQIAFGLTCTVLIFKHPQFGKLQDYNWAVDTWLGSAAVCDLLVSLAIVRSLWLSRTGIPRTNDLIMRLIMWTVNTGLITSVWAILDIALFTASPSTLIHLFFNVMLPKLYANTLLATLNHRRPSNREEDSYIGNISLSVARPRALNGQDAGVDTEPGGVHLVTRTIKDTANKDPEVMMYPTHPNQPSWSDGGGKAPHWETRSISESEV